MDQDKRKRIASLIKAWRKENGLTLDEMAMLVKRELSFHHIATHYSKGSICNWELGNAIPDPRLVSVLANSDVIPYLPDLKKLFSDIQEVIND